MDLFDLTPEQLNSLGFFVAASMYNTYTTDELDVIKNFFVCLQGNLAILISQKRFIDSHSPSESSADSKV